MKKILLASTLALCVTSAFAADPTAVLKVKGTLTNAACTPTLGNGGVADYGTIRLSELSATEVNQLGQKDIDLSINCSVPTKVAFYVDDDRPNTEAVIEVKNGDFNGNSVSFSSGVMGLGKTTDGVKIGNYSLFVKTDSIVLDGASGDFIYGSHLNTSSSPWILKSTGLISGDGADIFTGAAKGTVEPLAFTNATFPMAVSTSVQNTATLAITDDTDLDGQATLSLFYL